MKAKVIRDSIYVPNLEIGEIIEIIPGMETDSEGILNIPGGKLFLCKKSDGTFAYEFPSNLQVVTEEKECPKVQFDSFKEAVMPAREFLRNNYHPHAVIVIDYDGAHVYEATLGVPQFYEENHILQPIKK